MITKKNCHSKNALNLYKKHSAARVSRATVDNWYAEFNQGRDHFEDEPRAGRPRSVVTSESIEAVR